MSPARRRMWVRDPDSGGVTIPEAVKRRTEARLQQFAEQHFAGRYVRLDIRFHGQFCYINAYTDPEPPGDNWPPPNWHETREEMLERYELSMYPSGEFLGAPEDAFRVSAELYLGRG